MTCSVVVISHADADGHLIGEQVRRNLALVNSFSVEVVIDPDITKDHNVWHRLNDIEAIVHSEIVFFVDLMFSPNTFAEEASALVQFTKNNPEKKFFVMDHHPLPLRRLQSASNLRTAYRPDVFDCSVGPRSGMMVVAAICEKQSSNVSNIKRPEHDILAKGMRRASAHGGPLQGWKLLTLMRANRWKEIEALGRDSASLYKMPRGRWSRKQPMSATLKELDEAASAIAQKSGNASTVGSPPMPYDVDELESDSIANERFCDAEMQDGGRPAAHSKDLEAIATLLEVAALSLTTTPNATFEFDDLIGEARELGGKEMSIDERDAKIVLSKASFVRRAGSRYHLK